MADETTHVYAGWHDGEAHCACGAHFTSMQAFEQHVGMPVADETNIVASFNARMNAIQADYEDSKRADETNAGGLTDAEQDSLPFGPAFYPAVERIIAAREVEAGRQALRDAKAELERMLDTFPAKGRHTRARWATAYIDILIARADNHGGTP